MRKPEETIGIQSSLTSTKTDTDKIGLLLNDIEQTCDPPVGCEGCRRFTVECLSLIRHKLPSIATEAIGVAENCLAGHTGLEPVSEVLVGSWQYLDQHYPAAPLSDPNVSGIQAVIFLLHAVLHPEESDIVDHLSCFLMLVNNVEPHQKEQERLLYKHFGECLH